MRKAVMVALTATFTLATRIPAQELPDVQLGVHHDSNVEFAVTNFGIIGSRGGSYLDPETGLPAPGAEFPPGSDIDYLFMGALWIGAEIDTVDEYGNPVVDTLVSVGQDGWWDISELFPPPPGEESFWEDQIIGDEEFFAIYSDTATDPSFVGQDPFDQRPHIPLGLKITQNSIGWSSEGMDQLFIIHYVLENIGG